MSFCAHASIERSDLEHANRDLLWYVRLGGEPLGGSPGIKNLGGEQA